MQLWTPVVFKRIGDALGNYLDHDKSFDRDHDYGSHPGTFGYDGRAGGKDNPPLVAFLSSTKY